MPLICPRCNHNFASSQESYLFAARWHFLFADQAPTLLCRNSYDHPPPETFPADPLAALAKEDCARLIDLINAEHLSVDDLQPMEEAPGATPPTRWQGAYCDKEGKWSPVVLVWWPDEATLGIMFVEGLRLDATPRLGIATSTTGLQLAHSWTRDPSTGLIPNLDSVHLMDDPIIPDIRVPMPLLSNDIWKSLAGNTIMHRTIAEYDWASTALGPMHTWDTALVSNTFWLLNSGFPCVMFWGPERFLFYNDGAYFTWSYSPVLNAAGEIGGALTAVIETTANILTQRRVRCLHTLSTQMSKCSLVDEAIRVATALLAKDCPDVPVCLIYILDVKSNMLILKGASGLPDPHASMPSEIGLADSTVDSIWPMSEAVSSWGIHHMPVGSIWADASGGTWEDARPDHACVFGIRQSEKDPVLGVMVMGLNPRKRLDGPYREFCELIRMQLASGIQQARAYEQEKQRAEQLATLDKAKTEFFANVSHEFRTPLTLMLGPLADLLGAPGLSRVVREQLDVMNRATLRLLKLVNTILDFAGLESGRTSAQYVQSDVGTLTADAASMFRSAIEKGGLEFVVDVGSGPLLAYVDAAMWDKIVCNLLSNAYKFTLSGKIVLRLCKVPGSSGPLDEGVLRLSVEDTGCGIPAVAVKKLFERFYRVEGCAGRSHEGSGIGLALAMELVQIHGGKAWAESEPGLGTTMIVEIPAGSSHLPKDAVVAAEDVVTPQGNRDIRIAGFLAEALRWSDAGTRPSKSPSSESDSDVGMIPSKGLKSYRILLADDNADMREYVARLLETHYDVTVVNDGEEAYRVAKELIPDLIVSDWMMPGMSGIQLIAAIRQDPDLKYIPVILLSARAGEEARVEGLEYGADDYLVKPFSRKELMARVHTHLELGRLRNNLEAALMARESEFHLLCNMAPVGISRLESDGVVSFVNQTWIDIMGLSVEDADQWMSRVHPDDVEMVATQMLALKQRNPAAFSLETRIVIPDGMVKFVITHNAPLPQVNTNAVWFTAIVDVTETRRMQEERVAMLERKTEEERARANEADENRRHQETFIDMICHEIRNPLNGIINNADLLKDATDQRKLFYPLLSRYLKDAPGQEPESGMPMEIFTPATAPRADLPELLLRQDVEAIEAIQMCARHQQVITDDVLNLSKLRSKRIMLNPVWCDPADVLARVVRMFRAESAKKGVKLVALIKLTDGTTILFGGADSVPPIPDSVFIDADRLSQVVFNLLSNAMKFTEKAPTKLIEVVMELRDQETPPTLGPATLGSHSKPSPPLSLNPAARLAISVRDTGIGMTPEEQTALFQRFSQANGKTYKEYGGSGLGLFICKELVEYMDGTISVSSTRGKGTEFRAEVVCARRRVHAPSIAPALLTPNGALPSPDVVPKPEVQPSNVRLLVVEDNIVNQRVLQRQLEIVGFSYVVANNGIEAVDISGAEHFDVIIMDIEMPLMGGLEATRIIRARETAANVHHVPILGLSGNARDESRDRAMDAGMSGYMRKPYDRKQLFAALLKLVASDADGSIGEVPING
ncbi:hypothetical protein HKX48_005485 [Thoreauomyces humboldtii]|nr:hypothetical protein HKX48_005485 [Thoreauomyces humboldtii]